MSAIILRGLGFGDEGKGTMTAYLAKQLGIDKVIRDSGGPQGGHRVVDVSGTEHVFSQFSSAAFCPEVISYLSGGMLFKAPNFHNEAKALNDKGIANAAERVRIDPDCAQVTLLHSMVNKIKALALEHPYGSVGMGVGEAVFDRDKTPDNALYVRDCLNEETLREKIDWHYKQKFGVAREIVVSNPGNQAIADIFAGHRHWVTKERIMQECQNFRVHYGHLLEAPPEFFGTIGADETVIFEGTQGALLDPVYGAWPHVTKTCTTVAAAQRLVAKYLNGKKTVKVGILRAYFTRHGFGPFVTEEPKFPVKMYDENEKVFPWQGKFRAGWFDLLAARYGIAANDGIDSLALTNLDRLSGFREVKVCTAYLYSGAHPELAGRLFECSSHEAGVRIEAFKPYKLEVGRDKLAEILFECEPLEYRIFPGWSGPLSSIRQFSELPTEARNYVSFLESEEGLDVPISVISVGERSDQKFFHNPLW